MVVVVVASFLVMQLGFVLCLLLSVTECTKTANFPKISISQSKRSTCLLLQQTNPLLRLLVAGVVDVVVVVFLWFVCLPFLLLFKDHDSVLDVQWDL